MSATAVRAEGPADGTRSRPSWAVLLASVAILGIALALYFSGLLVRLGNDHQGHAILPPTVGAGDSVSGTLRLSNEGLLPVEVWLQPQFGGAEPPGSISVTVQDLDSGAYLYQGRMEESMGPLEVLLPAESRRIKVTVISGDPHATAAIPINFTYYWAARPALPWWWWIPTAALIILFLVAGYRRRARPAGSA